MSASHATVSVYLSAASIFLFIRVFPKTDNSGNVARIALGLKCVFLNI